MGIQTTFSIKDLENLSGIKAHTIRIWEKRYNLLQPIRTDTNIRTYDIKNLQRILNVSLLNQNGFKISKIAELGETGINKNVENLCAFSSNTGSAVNHLKMAMLNFDRQLFNKTYNKLLAKQSFSQVFYTVFLRFLDDIGKLWSCSTITPAHEHFIFTLIKQKLLLNIESVPTAIVNPDKAFVLFLPINEIHELGLLYIHYELLLKGYNSIYLGPSVPIDNLLELQKTFKETEFISYFTVAPACDNCENYISEIQENVLKSRHENFHILGRKTEQINKISFSKNIKFYGDINELTSQF